MRMSELMTPDVQTVKPSAPADEAFALMRRKGIRHLVVTDKSGIAGVLSERDAGGRAGAAAREGRTVADLMTPKVVTRAPGDTVRSAANVMRGRSIGCLPIVDRGRLVGIVTMSDMLDALSRGGDRPRASGQRAALHWRVPHKKTQRHRAW
jgi:acetoin utilization protein AcuB